MGEKVTRISNEASLHQGNTHTGWDFWCYLFLFLLQSPCFRFMQVLSFRKSANFYINTIFLTGTDCKSTRIVA